MKSLSSVAGLASALVLSAIAGSAAAAEQMIAVEPGVDIHVLDAGPHNAKPPLVLIPGWTMPGSIWKTQIDRFSTDRRVITLDPRSQGQSTKTAVGDSPDVRARDLKTVLDRLGAGPIVLVGWSQGVQDVAAFVNQFGTERLVGVVLVDSSISDGAAGIAKAPEAASQQLAMLDIYGRAPEAYLRGMLGAIITQPQPAGRIDALVADGLKTPPAIGTAMLIADLFGADRTGAISKLDRPVLVITSPRALDMGAQKAMAAKLPRARMEIVEGAGHAVFVDQPERFDQLMQGFLDGLG